MEATKRPWTHKPDKDKRSALYRILNCDGAELAWVNSEAHADLIVRAVNSHDALVDALDVAIAVLSDVYNRESKTSWHGQRVRSDIDANMAHLLTALNAARRE